MGLLPVVGQEILGFLVHPPVSWVKGSQLFKYISTVYYATKQETVYISTVSYPLEPGRTLQYVSAFLN